MHSVKFNISYFIIILFIRCVSIENNELPTISIDPNIELSNINLSEISNDVKLIPLETNKNSIISSISELVFLDNDNIIYKSGKSIIVFDGSGRHLSTIKAPGKGPREYNNIINLFVDSIERVIYVVDEKGIKIYDFEGNYVKTHKISFASAGLYKSSKKKFIVPVKQLYRDKERYMLHLYDSSFHKLKSFKSRNRDDYSKIKQNLFFAGTPYEIDNKVYYKEPFIDTIFKVTDKILIPHWSINLGNYKTETKEGVIISRKSTNKISPLGILENKDYFFINYFYKNCKYRSIFRKQSKEFIFHKDFSRKDYLNGISEIDFGIKNDLNEDFPTFWPVYIRDKFMVGIVYPIFMTYRQREKLSCKESDNPVLIIATNKI